MADTHNLKKLKVHILGLSEADNFEDAKLEWKLDHVYFTEGKCPCGVKINEHCNLKNSKNGKTTWVGNVCVLKFMDIGEAETLFSALRRVKKNDSAKPNTALIDYAWKRGYLYAKNEYEFLTSLTIHKRRKLSEKQKNWLQKINRRIIGSIVVGRLPEQVAIAEDGDDAAAAGHSDADAFDFAFADADADETVPEQEN